jgi:hypothetical protein
MNERLPPWKTWTKYNKVLEFSPTPGPADFAALPKCWPQRNQPGCPRRNMLRRNQVLLATCFSSYSHQHLYVQSVHGYEALRSTRSGIPLAKL